MNERWKEEERRGGSANGGPWSLPCINSNSLFTTVFKNFQWALQIERSHTSSKEGTYIHRGHIDTMGIVSM